VKLEPELVGMAPLLMKSSEEAAIINKYEIITKDGEEERVKLEPELVDMAPFS
jgi:hypothetical protein